MGEILVRREGAVAWVVFSNPAKLNAMTDAMWRRYPEVIAELDRDGDVHVIVLAGDGDRAFVSGADISQFDAVDAEPGAQAEYNRGLDAAFNAAVDCAKPVIASIRGICMGGGLGLAASCDIRIAADDAVFRMPAARLGVGYTFDGLRRFVDILGAANTSDIFFSARRFDANDALRMGFVNRVVPAFDLRAVVDEYCTAIADNAPLTIVAAKSAIRESRRDPGARDLDTVERLCNACFASDDYREGRTAFMEKRPPRFRGK